MKAYLFALSISVLLICSCSSNPETSTHLRHRGAGKEPVTVRVMKVAYVDNAAETSLVGTVKPSKSAVITVKYPGRVTKICVREGQWLQAGSVIAEIDAQNVQSSYDAARAVYEQAADAMERARQVYESGSISELRMVDIQTAYAKAEATYKAASRALDDCTVRAPFAGLAGEIYAHEGTDLQIGAPVIKMLDAGVVEIHASVPENEYANYRYGMHVRIEVPATDAILDGVLAVKGVEASRLTCSYDCTFKFSTPYATGGIMPGMLCRVHVPIGDGKAIVAPASAVMVDGLGRYVWCCNDGRASRRRVAVGGYSGNGIIVNSGLEPGDLLVIEGSSKISEGMTGINTVEWDE